MAAKLSGNNEKKVLLDVTPLSLGVELNGKDMSVVIPRNTPIPARKCKSYTTFVHIQSLVDICIYQGERSRSKDNHLLGGFTISGIPPAPKLTQKISVCFEIDANGILTVTAEILSTGKTVKLSITNANGSLTKEEIEKMVKDAEKYKDEDKEYKKRAYAYNALNQCLCNMKIKISDYNIKKRVHPEIYKTTENVIADTTEWLKDNLVASVDEFQRKKACLKSVCFWDYGS